MAQIRLVDTWLRSPASAPTHYRSVMVIAEKWAEQRVLMRAYAQSREQTMPTILLHGVELAIGPASPDVNGPWGIHVGDGPEGVEARSQAVKYGLEEAARRLAGSKGNPPRLRDEESTFEREPTGNWAPGTPRVLPHNAQRGQLNPSAGLPYVATDPQRGFAAGTDPQRGVSPALANPTEPGGYRPETVPGSGSIPNGGFPFATVPGADIGQPPPFATGGQPPANNAPYAAGAFSITSPTPPAGIAAASRDPSRAYIDDAALPLAAAPRPAGLELGRDTHRDAEFDSNPDPQRIERVSAAGVERVSAQSAARVGPQAVTFIPNGRLPVKVIPQGHGISQAAGAVAPSNPELRTTPLPRRHSAKTKPPPTGGRTALGYSSGSGAQSAIVRLGLAPHVSASLGRLAERVVPSDFHIDNRERRVLNALGETDHVTARQIGLFLGLDDAVTYMEDLIRKLETYGLGDLVEPAEAVGGEPSYRMKR